VLEWDTAGIKGEGHGLVFGHFRRGTNVKPEVDAWIAAQRLNRLAQAPSLRYGAPRVLVCGAKKPAAT
jgi:hypothetical protein